MAKANTGPPALGYVFAGRLVTGALKCLVALLLAWLGSKAVSVDTAFSEVAAALVLAYLISEIAAVLIERPLVLRAGRSVPGGMAYALLPLAASIIISFAASYALTRSMGASALVTASVLACNVAELLWLKPWEPGPSPEEEHATFNEFKAMTKEHFADDVAQIRHQATERTKEKYYRAKARKEAKDPGKDPDSE